MPSSPARRWRRWQLGQTVAGLVLGTVPLLRENPAKKPFPRLLHSPRGTQLGNRQDAKAPRGRWSEEDPSAPGGFSSQRRISSVFPWRRGALAVHLLFTRKTQLGNRQDAKAPRGRWSEEDPSAPGGFSSQRRISSVFPWRRGALAVHLLYRFACGEGANPRSMFGNSHRPNRPCRR